MLSARRSFRPLNRCHKDDHTPGCWMQANVGHVYDGHERGLVVRTLFETPRVVQPEKIHGVQRRVCVRC